MNDKLDDNMARTLARFVTNTGETPMVAFFRLRNGIDLGDCVKVTYAMHCGDDNDARQVRIRAFMREYGFVFDTKGTRKVCLHVWQRDCDHCEGTSRSLIDATYEAYEAFEDGVYDQAEGPVSITFMTTDEYADFTPSFRDRAAEAAGY